MKIEDLETETASKCKKILKILEIFNNTIQKEENLK
jgi:hypothetical protein